MNLGNNLNSYPTYGVNPRQHAAFPVDHLAEMLLLHKNLRTLYRMSGHADPFREATRRVNYVTNRLIEFCDNLPVHA